ncbi:MAG: nuclear transport factor 2 family protein [Alphaproteobacteria bacterium]|nr:MAG: nuclear transport factor 2 family protein [Alphaproteobacteria bacterium]
MAQTDFQTEKRIVLDHLAALDAAGPEEAAGALARHTAPDWLWRGMHPFHEQTGAEAVAEAFWSPLKRAMGPLQRRPDMFLAGRNQIDGFRTVWVIQMGHMMGLWDAPFLGIPPSRKIAFLRYAEFHRIEDGRIADSACFTDLISLMVQAGLEPLPPQTGANILTPGPRTHDGLLYGAQDPAEGRRTLDLITAMIEDLIGIGVASPVDHLAKWWLPDMCWFGPAGIGASAFFKGYHRGHTDPFEEGLEFIRHYGHVARLAEGNFGGFFGWPSMQMRMTGGFMGMPANTEPADMRIVDLYRREGDRLAENWVFIDLLHFYHMQGLDILGRTLAYPRT